MDEYKRQLKEAGIKSLLIKLNVLEKAEDYEACARIKRVIDEHNEVATEKLPTRLKREEIYALK